MIELGKVSLKHKKIVNDYQNNLDYNLNLHLEKTETSTGYHVPSITTKESYPGEISCFKTLSCFLKLKGSPNGRYHPQRISTDPLWFVKYFYFNYSSRLYYRPWICRFDFRRLSNTIQSLCLDGCGKDLAKHLIGSLRCCRIRFGCDYNCPSNDSHNAT